MLGFFRIFAVKKQIILQYLTGIRVRTVYMPTTKALTKMTKSQLIMTRHFIFTVLSLFIAMTVAAQDDDMYFTPKHQKNNTTVRTPRSEVSDAYDYNDNYNSHHSNDNGTYYSGSIRNVDEYNRRGRYSTQQSWRDTTYYANDSILVSREDYENSRRMKRFDGYNSVTLIVGDPWYYDSWAYDPWYNGSWYWRSRWYDPWYYSYYDPWRFDYGWHGYWGYSHYYWDHSYYWHRPAPVYGGWHGSGFRPTPGRPSGGNWQRPNNNYTTNRPGTRIYGDNRANRNVGRIMNSVRNYNGQGNTTTQRNTTRQYTPTQPSRSNSFSNTSRSGASFSRSSGGFSGGGRSMGGGSRGIGRR